MHRIILNDYCRLSRDAHVLWMADLDAVLFSSTTAMHKARMLSAGVCMCFNARVAVVGSSNGSYAILMPAAKRLLGLPLVEPDARKQYCRAMRGYVPYARPSWPFRN